MKGDREGGNEEQEGEGEVGGGGGGSRRGARGSGRFIFSEHREEKYYQEYLY